VTEIEALLASGGRARFSVDHAGSAPEDERVYRTQGEVVSVAAARERPVFLSTNRLMVFEETHGGWRGRAYVRSLRYANGGELWGIHGWVGIHEPDEGRLFRWNEAKGGFDEWDVVREVVPLDLINHASAPPIVLPALGSRLFTATFDAGRVRLDPLGTDLGDDSGVGSGRVPRLSQPTCGAHTGRTVIVGGLDAGHDAYVWTSSDLARTWDFVSMPSRPMAASCSDEACFVVLADGSVLAFDVEKRSLDRLNVAPAEAPWSGLGVNAIAVALGARPRIVLAGVREESCVSVDITADSARMHEGLGCAVFRDGAGRLWLTGPGLYQLNEDGSLHQRWPSDREPQ
jgi:hypothetical protein